MLVPLRAGPDRRERHHVREVERRDRRLADIGVDMAGKAAEPGLDRVDSLAHAGEVAALDRLLDEKQPLVRDARIFIPDGHSRGHVGFADEVGTKLLQCRVGVLRLVGGIAVQEDRRLVGHHLLQDRHDRFALGEPLPANADQHLGGVGLVEADRARRPAIGEGEPVQIVEQARPGLRREAHHGQGAEVGAAETRFEPARQLLVCEDRVEVHRRLRHAHALMPGGDAGMQVGQRLRVIEPFGFGHEALDEREDPVGAIDEAREKGAPVGASARQPLVKPAFGARRLVGRRQPQQGQEISALEMRTFFLELRPALGIDETRRGIGK